MFVLVNITHSLKAFINSIFLPNLNNKSDIKYKDTLT